MRNIANKSEIATAVVLIAILIMFTESTGLSMPTNMGPMFAVFLTVTFLVFSSFVWKENSADERESLHVLNAGRISFLAGSFVLVVGIVYQSFKHSIDPWLVYALVIMILAKIASRVYSEKNR